MKRLSRRDGKATSRGQKMVQDHRPWASCQMSSCSFSYMATWQSLKLSVVNTSAVCLLHTLLGPMKIHHF